MAISSSPGSPCESHILSSMIYLHPKKGRDMKILEGKGAYQNYNAHYIPVVSINPQNPKMHELLSLPSKPTAAWDEIVVFQRAQTLPRFWVKITKDTIPTLLTPDTLTQNGSRISKKLNQEIPQLNIIWDFAIPLAITSPRRPSSCSWFQQAANQGTHLLNTP